MNSEPKILLSTVDDVVAAEKGRLLAAQNIARDPEARKRCEEAYGVGYCRLRWPEAYKANPFQKGILDVLTFKTY
jgi:hypothetical protein